MPRGTITKDQIKCDVLKIKRELNDEIHSDEEKSLAHKYLDKVLAKIEEYRYWKIFWQKGLTADRNAGMINKLGNPNKTLLFVINF